MCPIDEEKAAEPASDVPSGLAASSTGEPHPLPSSNPDEKGLKAIPIQIDDSVNDSLEVWLTETLEQSEALQEAAAAASISPGEITNEILAGFVAEGSEGCASSQDCQSQAFGLAEPAGPPLKKAKAGSADAPAPSAASTPTARKASSKAAPAVPQQDTLLDKEDCVEELLAAAASQQSEREGDRGEGGAEAKITGVSEPDSALPPTNPKKQRTLMAAFETASVTKPQPQPAPPAPPPPKAATAAPAASSIKVTRQAKRKAVGIS